MIIHTGTFLFVLRLSQNPLQRTKNDLLCLQENHKIPNEFLITRVYFLHKLITLAASIMYFSHIIVEESSYINTINATCYSETSITHRR